MSIHFEIINLTTGQPESHAVVRIDTEDRQDSGVGAVVVALCFSQDEAETQKAEFTARSNPQ